MQYAAQRVLYRVTQKTGLYFEGVAMLHFLLELNETSVITYMVCGYMVYGLLEN